MKTTKQDIISALSDAMDEIMLKLEQSEGCESGDITPMQAYAMGEAIDTLADIMMAILRQNKPNNDEEG